MPSHNSNRNCTWVTFWHVITFNSRLTIGNTNRLGLTVAKWWGRLEMVLFLAAIWTATSAMIFSDSHALRALLDFVQTQYDLGRYTFGAIVIVLCSMLTISSYLMTCGTIHMIPGYVMPWFFSTTFLIGQTLYIILKQQLFYLMPIPTIQVALIVTLCVSDFRRPTESTTSFR